MDDLKKLVESWGNVAFGEVFARNCVEPDRLETFARLAMQYAAEEAAKCAGEQWDIDGSCTAGEFASAIRERFKAL